MVLSCVKCGRGVNIQDMLADGNPSSISQSASSLSDSYSSVPPCSIVMVAIPLGGSENNITEHVSSSC